MSLLGALSGGIVGSVVLVTAQQAATGLRIARIDLPFVLGSALVAERGLAKGTGYAIHTAVGLGFATVYWLLFEAVGSAALWIGALLGLVHGLATASVLVPVVLPAVHPRLGGSDTSARSTPPLGRPGFLMLAYGRAAAAVTVGAHVLYGVIVAAFTGAA